MIAHGVSRGLASYRSPAPAGAKESGWEIKCSALSFVAPPGLIYASALSHGSRRGLMSCASPRLMLMVHNLGIKRSPLSPGERHGTFEKAPWVRGTEG